MDRAGAAWTLCALAVLAGTYFAFIERDLLWGGVLTVGGMLAYFWVLGRAMVGRWDNFKRF